MKPTVLKGDSSVDDRGKVSFVNGFAFKDIKRFYTVENHSKHFVRAWHGHKHEKKYVYVPRGAVLVAAVEVSDWSNPERLTEVTKCVLSGDKPEIFCIPEGYANGFMTLTDDAEIIFYSTATLEESIKDDYRFPASTWNIWKVEYR